MEESGCALDDRDFTRGVGRKVEFVVDEFGGGILCD